MRWFIFLLEPILSIVKVNSTFRQISRPAGNLQNRQVDAFFVDLVRNVLSLRPVRFPTSICDYDNVLDVFEMFAVFH